MNSHWPWKKESGSSESAADRFFLRYDLLVRSLSDITATADGQETIDGEAANTVTLTPVKPSADMPASFKIWISKDSGLPLKFVTEVDKDSKNTATFDFRSPVKIGRPVEGKK